MFEEEFDHLNDMQQQAVKTIDQNLLVVAPAGTGKTKVIALRTAELIHRQVPAEKILCLTFTNKAAKEMTERMGVYIPEVLKDLMIKTFHAFCYHLICHEKKASHFSFPCTLVDETDTEEILKKIMMQNHLEDEGLYYPSLLSYFENIKKYSLKFPVEERYIYKKIAAAYEKEQPEALKKYGRSSALFIQRYGYRLLNTYTKYLRENNCIDFTDLVIETYYLLEQPEILEKWQRQYDYFQIDEMQDTSCIEYQLIAALGKNKHMALFGDFNQTIYEWRGSDPQSMIKAYKEAFKPIELTLKINYRSTKVLLKAANDYIASSRLYPAYCEPVSLTEGEKITLIPGKDKEDEIKKLAQSIKGKKENKSTAVLTRTNGYAKEIAAYFTKVGIPCTVIEDTKFFRQKVIKTLLAFFDYSINDRNGHALQKICEHPYLGMEKWLLKTLKASKNAYLYLQDWFKMTDNDPYMQLFKAHTVNEIVVLDVEATGLCTTEDEIIQIAAVAYGEKGVTQKLDVLLKPSRSVGDSFYVHGFSDEQLQKEGIPPGQALMQLYDFTKGKVLVGHNINYDLQIISSMLSRYGLKQLEETGVYDTLDLAQKVYPKLPNHKLDTLSKLIVTQTAPTHNAFQDILATSEVLDHLMLKIKEKKQERFEAMEAYSAYVEAYRAKLFPLKAYILSHPIEQSLTYMMNECGFKAYYTGDELDHIRELYRICEGLKEEGRSYKDQIIQLLAFSALHYSEIEQSDLFKNRIPIITVHQAKGLEFNEVYLAGCNDRVFPSYRSIRDNHLTEEMRLFYVGMTRAKEKLYLSYHEKAARSIFIEEIGDQYKTYENNGEMM